MGWATKKGKRWELSQLKWTFLSILMFVPHIHPFVMMSQAAKSKVRSWYALAWILLFAELALLGSVYVLWGAWTKGMLFTFFGYIASYIVGNGVLLNQAKPYLQRLELGEIRPLQWINSISEQKKMQLAQSNVETAETFVAKLVHYRKQVPSIAIQTSVDKIIRLFHLIEQRDTMEAEKFLVRHGTVANVLREYHDLEQTRLTNPITMESKKKLEQVLVQAAGAIEQDVTNLIKSRLLDVSAESDVYIQTLRNKNLLK